MATQTLRGHGLVVELDTDEIIPDDPGAGTPAIVLASNGRRAATYWCATDTGEVDGVILTAAQADWLEDQRDTVERFLRVGR
jgi:hypothetical protein